MVQNLFLRPACAQCQFKGFRHPGDITLGDFWGIWNLDEKFDDNKGVSAVICNTEKGMLLLKSCLEKLERKEVFLKDIKCENPSWVKSSYVSSQREIFFDGMRQGKSITGLVRELTSSRKPQKRLIDYLFMIKHRLLRR